jgi:hypothetical protein
VALISGSPRLSRIGRAYSALGELTALDVEVFATVEAAETWLQHQQTAS